MLRNQVRLAGEAGILIFLGFLCCLALFFSGAVVGIGRTGRGGEGYEGGFFFCGREEEKEQEWEMEEEGWAGRVGAFV